MVALEIDILALGFGGLFTLLIVNFLFNFIHLRRLIKLSEAIYKLEESMGDVIAQLIEGNKEETITEEDIKRLESIREALKEE